MVAETMPATSDAVPLLGTIETNSRLFDFFPKPIEIYSFNVFHIVSCHRVSAQNIVDIDNYFIVLLQITSSNLRQ